MAIIFLLFTLLFTLFIVKKWSVSVDNKSQGFGVPNYITLFRNYLVFLIIYLAFLNSSSFLILIPAVSVLLMDGLDGYFARRLKLSSEFGARFDMESDAFFILVLSCIVYVYYIDSFFVLLIGGMRYIYVALSYFFDFLNNPLKERYSRKVFCVIQIMALILPFTGFFNTLFLYNILFLSFSLLLFSFSRDAFDQFYHVTPPAQK